MAKGATAAEVVGTMKGSRALDVRSRALRFAVTSDVTSGGGNSLRKNEVVSWFDGRLRIP